ncbi:hypothetical protein F5887DRAFT_1091634 [Amanita rubescens]|nr:hypothetical protein F5887DRAFT_1091634 [Amanita rubescens]
MSSGVIDNVKKVLHLREEALFISRCSTDRTNIKILVCPILNPIRTFRDLSFLLCNWKLGDPPPPKFLVFFDNINESVLAGLFLRSLLPKDQHHRVKWFNSEMSDKFKRNEAGRLAWGETWGLMATDSFGMGMDLPDIAIVIQWRATPSISALWQRFGCCVRDPTLEGTAIFFAEKEYFDVLANEKKKRKRNSSSIKIEPGTSSTAKQTKLGPSTSRSAASWDHEASDEEGEEEGEEEEEAEGEEKDDSDDAEDEKDDEKGKEKKKKPSTYSRKKSKKEKIEPAVFTLLNADTRGVSCRCQPFSDQFENTKAVSLHLECDPSMLNGCDRCRPAVIETCCDIHNPELASLYR